MKIEQILELDMSKPGNADKLQHMLHQIPYIKNRCKDALALGIDADFRILETVLQRLRQNDLAISFIMSDQGHYEMVLLGVGKWCLPDKEGKLKMYRVIGTKAYCTSLYECVAKAVICLYQFIQQHKRE